MLNNPKIDYLRNKVFFNGDLVCVKLLKFNRTTIHSEKHHVLFPDQVFCLYPSHNIQLF
jgi:hypothetical protein